MKVREVVWVQVKEFALCELHYLTTPIMFYGILRTVTTLKHALIVSMLISLPSAVCIPTTPDSAEGCGPDPGVTTITQEVKKTCDTLHLPIGGI